MTRSTLFNSVRARSLRAARELCLVVAALALLAAQAASTLHFALVPHHLCAQHGVLEDGTARVRADKHDHSREVVATDSGDAADAHEECSMATRSQHLTLPAHPALERAQVDGAATAVDSARVWLGLDRAALLSCAPKTSPPQPA